MESTLQTPTLVGSRISPRATTIVFWIAAALFCLEMTFTAYYELLPQGAEAFARLGFPAGYFRMELSIAKLAGVAALLLPIVPARVKEWAYAGFAINLASALVTHLALRQGPQSWRPSSALVDMSPAEVFTPGTTEKSPLRASASPE